MRRTDFPVMTSCDGCATREVKNACCTIVKARPTEAKRIKRYTEEHDVHWMVNDGIACGFLHDGQCSIYEVRPWVCRAFGVVKQLPCSHFPEEAIIDFPAEKTQALGWSSPDDAFLGYYFEPGYYERMKVALKPHGYWIGAS